MPNESDDVIVLQHSWCLASKSNQYEFYELIQQTISPPPLQDPYSAALQIWCRLPPSDQTSLLRWIGERLKAFTPQVSIAPHWDSTQGGKEIASQLLTGNTPLVAAAAKGRLDDLPPTS